MVRLVATVSGVRPNLTTRAPVSGGLGDLGANGAQFGGQVPDVEAEDGHGQAAVGRLLSWPGIEPIGARLAIGAARDDAAGAQRGAGLVHGMLLFQVLVSQVTGHARTSQLVL